jgi:Small, acid-soluble spore proteins, alpha/beta type
MANNQRRNRNALVVPGADLALEKFKNEIAAELGVSNYGEIDKGALPARLHGLVGGSMTKRLIELGQQAIMNGTPSVEGSNIDYQKYVGQMQDEIGRNLDASYEAAPIVPTQTH